jgi:hypothetical protein
MLKTNVGKFDTLKTYHKNFNSRLFIFQGSKFIERLMLTFTTRSHITCNKKGAIAKVMGAVKIFEFEIWGRFKGQHLQTSYVDLGFIWRRLDNLPALFHR